MPDWLNAASRLTALLLLAAGVHAEDNSCVFETEPGETVTWSGWGNSNTNARFQGALQSGISSGNVSRLQLKWAFGFEDSVRRRSQPLVTSDTIFVGSQSGDFFALDIESGCIRWHFKAEAEVRGAISSASVDGNLQVLFSDFEANIYRLNAKDGSLVWKKNIATHPTVTITGSIAAHGDLLFVPLSSTEVISAINGEYECCTFRGAVIAMDLLTGDREWIYYTVPAPLPRDKNSEGTQQHGPSGAPVWSSPAIDAARGLIYFGTGQNYSLPASAGSNAVVAITMKTGKELWTTQTLADDVWNAGCVTNGINCAFESGPDFDIGTSPILAILEDGQQRVFAGQKSGAVFALDPDSGDIVWHRQIARGGRKGGIHWGLSFDGNTLFAPVADLPGEEYDGRESKPGLHALDPATGTHRWYQPALPVCDSQVYDCYASYSASATTTDGLVFVGAMNGRVSALNSENGELLWAYDTAREFDTVNGVPGSGGSVDAYGPIPVHGNLIVNSGYDLYGQINGNVLLVFGLTE